MSIKFTRVTTKRLLIQIMESLDKLKKMTMKALVDLLISKNLVIPEKYTKQDLIMIYTNTKLDILPETKKRKSTKKPNTIDKFIKKVKIENNELEQVVVKEKFINNEGEKMCVLETPEYNLVAHQDSLKVVGVWKGMDVAFERLDEEIQHYCIGNRIPIDYFSILRNPKIK